MKSIDEIFDDVKPGDLVKLHLDGENRTFVGYVWFTSRFDFAKEQNARAHWAMNPSIDTDSSKIYLAGLNPDALEPGNDGLITGIQFVGIDGSGHGKGTIQGIKIKGYEILEKSKNLYLSNF